MNVRYQKDGKMEFCHTLNSTAVATGRALCAIFEIYQQKDGSIKIPAVLVSYMNGQKVIKAISPEKKDKKTGKKK
jgi:seryl-tRNA synthetase